MKNEAFGSPWMFTWPRIIGRSKVRPKPSWNVNPGVKREISSTSSKPLLLIVAAVTTVIGNGTFCACSSTRRAVTLTSCNRTACFVSALCAPIWEPWSSLFALCARVDETSSPLLNTTAITLARMLLFCFFIRLFPNLAKLWLRGRRILGGHTRRLRLFHVFVDGPCGLIRTHERAGRVDELRKVLAGVILHVRRKVSKAIQLLSLAAVDQPAGPLPHLHPRQPWAGAKPGVDVGHTLQLGVVHVGQLGEESEMLRGNVALATGFLGKLLRR